MAIPMDEFLRPRVGEDPDATESVGRVAPSPATPPVAWPTVLSILLVLAGVAGVLVSIALLADWRWSLLLGAAGSIYAGYVLATRS